MTQLTHPTARKAKPGRKRDWSSSSMPSVVTDATASALDATMKQAGLQRLLGELQTRFTDTPDVAYLIESEVQQRTAELYYKANYDSLTHLPNRGYFHELLDDLVQSATEAQTDFSLLFLDLDGFKSVNDTLGHHIGDDLLRYVSARLLAAVRQQDVVCRLGGDEFVILLPERVATAEIESVCQRIVDEVARPYWFDGQEVRTSSSIGIAQFPQDSKLASELIEQADEALYLSKSRGKRTFCFYQDVQSQAPEKSQDWQRAFREALRHNRFFTVVEPQVDLKQNRVVGGSVCLHWTHAEAVKKREDATNATSSPVLHPPYEEWQGLLRSSGQEMSIGNWLLDTACYYVKQWSAWDAELMVTVPVFESLWQQDDLLAKMRQRLHRFDIAPNQLQLAFALAHLEQVEPHWMARLQALSEAGFQLTLTGLGASPLQLASLSGLNVQEMKFDQVWLKRHMVTPEGQKWIQALIQMAQGLDACVMATGLSEESEVSALRDWGCHFGQGPYWSLPMATERFEALLR